MIPIDGHVYEPMYEYNEKRYKQITINKRTSDYIHGLKESK